MNAQRRIEIFSAGCPVCEATIRQIEQAACPACAVEVRDVREAAVAARAQRLGLRSIPAVVIDGTVAACCVGAGPDVATLQAAGLGQPLR